MLDECRCSLCAPRIFLLQLAHKDYTAVHFHIICLCILNELEVINMLFNYMCTIICNELCIYSSALWAPCT